MQRANRSKGGMTFVETLIIVAFALLWFLGITLAMELVKDTQSHYIILAVSAGCILIIAGSIVFKAKSDSGSASMYAAILSLIAAITLWVIFFGEGQLAALGAAVITTIATVAGFAWMLKISKTPEQFPSALWEKFDKKKIYELAGVQFAAQAPKTLKAGTHDFIDLYIQNCWDEPRSFTVTAKGGKGLIFHGQTQITVEAVAVGILRIPVAASHQAKGNQHLKFIPAVIGKGGKRVRRKRAKSISTDGTALAARLIFGTLGAILVKPGLKVPFHIEPDPNPAAGHNQMDLPAATWEEIFKPEAHHFIKPIG